MALLRTGGQMLAGLAAAGFLAAAAPAFRVGSARAGITPAGSIRMAGYAARKHASEGVARPLLVKALAVEDTTGRRAVIVTMDLLRVPKAVTDEVVAQAESRYGLRRAQILLNCSHNHSGPLLWENDPFPAVPAPEYEDARRYTLGLAQPFVTVIGQALDRMAPADLYTGTAEAGFAANRRVAGRDGFEIAYNPAGPVDHRVPMLQFRNTSGQVVAVLFGYACHNTTAGPETYQIHGDYAGYAQDEIEHHYPGSTALFLQLCAGDQDPHPRGSLDLARQHGHALAQAVTRVNQQALRRVRGSVGSAFENVSLALAPHTRATFESRLNDPLAAKVRNARTMLKLYDEGKPIRAVEYPVQAVRLGSVRIVALGGEPVIDYALRARREFPGVIVAGYSNRVMSYVPSRRVLGEGGYEAGDSAIYYGLPGPYTAEVEETIFAAMARVLRAAR